jgi:TusA-related sulfurtransferase
MGNNPIWYNDPLGDIFKIGSKDKQAKSDVQSLAKKKNQDYIKFNDESGEVTLDFGSLSQKKIDRILKKDAGLRLIGDLSTAKNAEGNDLTFFYGTEGETGIGLEYPDMQKNVPDYYSNISTLTNKGGTFNDEFGGYDPRAFVLNASTQQYSASSQYGLKPLDGYDGKVFIGQGTFKIFGQVNDYNSPIRDNQGTIVGYKQKVSLLTVQRSSVVYHELRENLLRTLNGYCYDEAHQKAGGVGEVSRFFPTTK